MTVEDVEFKDELTADTDIFPANPDKENKPFFLSFIEEYWQDQRPNSAVGRIEVHDARDKSEWACEEIRIGTFKLAEYQRFRDKWDWKEVTKEELEQIREEAKRL